MATRIHTRFGEEAVALFLELDAAPARVRQTQEFKDKKRQLANLLDLGQEFWTGNSVLDRSAAPDYPPEFLAHGDWIKCRAIRKLLLAAASPARPKPPPEADAAPPNGRLDRPD